MFVFAKPRNKVKRGWSRASWPFVRGSAVLPTCQSVRESALAVRLTSRPLSDYSQAKVPAEDVWSPESMRLHSGKSVLS